MLMLGYRSAIFTSHPNFSTFVHWIDEIRFASHPPFPLLDQSNPKTCKLVQKCVRAPLLGATVPLSFLITVLLPKSATSNCRLNDGNAPSTTSTATAPLGSSNIGSSNSSRSEVRQKLVLQEDAKAILPAIKVSEIIFSPSCGIIGKKTSGIYSGLGCTPCTKRIYDCEFRFMDGVAWRAELVAVFGKFISHYRRDFLATSRHLDSLTQSN